MRAVAALALALAAGPVTIEDEALGHPDMMLDGQPRLFTRDWVITALAGREAERLFFPEAALIPGGDGGDIAVARKALDLADGRHEMLLGIWLDGLRPAARALVRGYRGVASQRRGDSAPNALSVMAINAPSAK